MAQLVFFSSRSGNTAKFVARLGQGAQVTHPTTTLEDLFVKIVRDQTGGSGSYTSSDA